MSTTRQPEPRRRSLRYIPLMKGLLLLLILALGGLGCAQDPDDYSCRSAAWAPGDCDSPRVLFDPNTARSHVLGDIDYNEAPPSSGSHNPSWAKWGEYEYLPPENWLHNLEHGGVALLYHPCADEELVDSLRESARSRPEDDGGPFRWVLTPFIDLPSAFAVVMWEWSMTAECVDSNEVGTFVETHYRQAPEDIAGDGAFDEGWIGL